MKVGSKVAALYNHPDGYYKRGDVFTVLDVGKSTCKCSYHRINIGLIKSTDWAICDRCSTPFFEPTEYRWQDARDFCEIDDSLSETTYEDIMTEIAEQELQTA